jgi:tight adherence protein C
MIVLTSVTASVAVFFFALWYLRTRHQLESRIRALGDQQRMVLEYQDPFAQRVAFPVVDGLVSGLMTILPTSMVARSRKWLVIAGDKMTPGQFYSIVLICATVPPAIYFILVFAVSGAAPSAGALFLMPLFAFLGLVAPLFFLRRAARLRQKTIWRSLPNALDLMTTCVEAGLSLDFALQRVAERYKGPLSDEINRTLRETGLGRTRKEALTDMAERVDIPDVATFVNSVVQAETLGTSIGAVLRAHSADLRRRRRQRAEQIARHAPVKMVFPTVFFLMPSLFIITIGPMMLHIFYDVR